MKEVNLISLCTVHKKLDTVLFESFLKYHSINIDTDEIHDLDFLVKELKAVASSVYIFDKFFIGYEIPQIGKEFDLLRIGRDVVVNIEIKKTSTHEKVKKQLVRNKYYLNFLNKEVLSFTYIVDENKLYKLDINENIVKAKIIDLNNILQKQVLNNICDINTLFKPSNYLVSPFNSTKIFIDEKYFLTSRQEEIKGIILNDLDSSKHSIIAIKGKAGTGKTLLTFDIAKDYQISKKVLVIHCGILNSGHDMLIRDYGWNVVAIKQIYNIDLSNYSLIVVDEAQRIYLKQLYHIIDEIKRLSNNCIFSYDGQQTLSRKEIISKVGFHIEKQLTMKAFELTNKIRTNIEVSTFIKSLFNKGLPVDKLKYTNIDFSYFDNFDLAKSYLNQVRTEGWKVINYTPTRSSLIYDNYNINDEADNAHTVIGQEFDNVVAVIDGHFYYNDNDLATRFYRFEPPYHTAKMLYQIVSRTRIKLKIVIISNPEILQRCLHILN